MMTASTARLSPGLAFSLETVRSRSARSTFSIFIASTTASVSPALTSCPSATEMETTRPGIGHRSSFDVSGGSFTGVGIRIGWVLRGDNDPKGINAEGGGRGAGGEAVQPDDEKARDLLWFRSMWLSHRDFQNLFETAITADASGWPSPGIVVNGVSANSNGLWDMTEAQRWLGHVSQDDAFARLGIVPEA